MAIEEEIMTEAVMMIVAMIVVVNWTSAF